MSLSSKLTVTQISPSKGLGLIATAQIDPGEVLITEKPLAWVPVKAETGPRGHCYSCGKVRGELRQRLEMIGEKRGLFPRLPKELPFLQEDGDDHPHAHELTCPGCNLVTFCSSRCRDESPHTLICNQTNLPESHPLGKFYKFAALENPFFDLSLRLVARVVADWRQNGHVAEGALASFSALIQREFWEVCTPDSGRRPTKKNLEIFKNNVNKTVQKAYKLICGIFEGDQDLFKTLTLERYSRLLGMLRLNCIAIQFPVPEGEYMAILSSLPPKDQEAAGSSALGEFLRELVHSEDDSSSEGEGDSDEEEDDEDDAEDESDEEEDPKPTRTSHEKSSSSSSFVPGIDFEEIAGIIGEFEGSGLFPTISRCNHSCVPNASVDFVDNKEAKMVATRTILPGEEVFISYIEEEEEREFEDRRDALRDYGFECDCRRCREENPANQRRKKQKQQ